MNTTTTNSLYSSTTQNVTANWIEWLTATTNTLGNISTGTLIYTQSSINNLQAGRTILVRDSLVAYGTPCVPVTIQSATSGTQAILNSGSCNFDILFGNLRDINAILCITSENKLVGTNGGGNTNWTFTPVAAFTPLGNDTTIVCNDVPLSIDASGFGSMGSLTYTWNTGATTPVITTDTPGTYFVIVDYGASCFISDTIIVDCTVPLPLQLTSFNGISENCTVNLHWSTAIENQVAYITVEGSSNALKYNAYKQVPATGNYSNYAATLENNRDQYPSLIVILSIFKTIVLQIGIIIFFQILHQKV